MLYRIENISSGLIFGDYEADTPMLALDVYAQECGHQNYANLLYLLHTDDFYNWAVESCAENVDIEQIASDCFDKLADRVACGKTPSYELPERYTKEKGGIQEYRIRNYIKVSEI